MEEDKREEGQRRGEGRSEVKKGEVTRKSSGKEVRKSEIEVREVMIYERISKLLCLKLKGDEDDKRR